MSVLQDKYKALIDAANAAGISGLQISEQENVLHVNGNTSSQLVKDNLWKIYDQIDPDYRSGDLVLDVNVTAATGAQAKVVTESTNLNIRETPGTDQAVVGKAAHGEIVTILEQTNNQWWKIKTNSGVEGYVFAQYLSIQ